MLCFPVWLSFKNCVGLICGVLLCCSVAYMSSFLFWSWRQSTELTCFPDPSLSVTFSHQFLSCHCESRLLAETQRSSFLLPGVLLPLEQG